MTAPKPDHAALIAAFEQAIINEYVECIGTAEAEREALLSALTPQGPTTPQENEDYEAVRGILGAPPSIPTPTADDAAALDELEEAYADVLDIPTKVVGVENMATITDRHASAECPSESHRGCGD